MCLKRHSREQSERRPPAQAAAPSTGDSLLARSAGRGDHAKHGGSGGPQALDHDSTHTGIWQDRAHPARVIPAKSGTQFWSGAGCEMGPGSSPGGHRALSQATSPPPTGSFPRKRESLLAEHPAHALRVRAGRRSARTSRPSPHRQNGDSRFRGNDIGGGMIRSDSRRIAKCQFGSCELSNSLTAPVL